jgi:DNA (cytosine-5)-methyltransferase 1
MQGKTKLRYISLFSGIEAWSCAVRDMPEYEPVAFCEIDPFASAVLKHHYPNVPNLGDIRNIDGTKYKGKVDLIVGGSPCQNFSCAGNSSDLLL